jgi:hypothetical protein
VTELEATELEATEPKATEPKATEPNATELEALQAALAGEHAAVWAYGALGARLQAADRRAALAALDAHRARRDRLSDLVRDRQGTPVAASLSYELPRSLRTAADAVVLAVLVEERLAATYADLVTAAAGSLRPVALAALRDAAVRAALWRGGSVPFPGLPERSSG